VIKDPNVSAKELFDSLKDRPDFEVLKCSDFGVLSFQKSDFGLQISDLSARKLVLSARIIHSDSKKEPIFSPVVQGAKRVIRGPLSELREFSKCLKRRAEGLLYAKSCIPIHMTREEHIKAVIKDPNVSAKELFDSLKDRPDFEVFECSKFVLLRWLPSVPSDNKVVLGTPVRQSDNKVVLGTPVGQSEAA